MGDKHEPYTKWIILIGLNGKNTPSLNFNVVIPMLNKMKSGVEARYEYCDGIGHEKRRERRYKVGEVPSLVV